MRSHIKTDLMEPEVLKQISKYKSLGFSFDDIAKKLQDDLGIERVDRVSVMKSYNAMMSRSSEIIAGDDEVKGILKDAVIDQASQLKRINTIMNETLDELDGQSKTENIDVITKVVKEIRKQISLQAQLLGAMREGFDNRKINKIEYTKISINNLTELEKSGYIKIIRKPGEVYDPEAGELIMLSQRDLEVLSEKGQLYLKNHIIKIDGVIEVEAEVENEDGKSEE